MGTPPAPMVVRPYRHRHSPAEQAATGRRMHRADWADRADPAVERVMAGTVRQIPVQGRSSPRRKACRMGLLAAVETGNKRRPGLVTVPLPPPRRPFSPDRSAARETGRSPHRESAARPTTGAQAAKAARSAMVRTRPQEADPACTQALSLVL